MLLLVTTTETGRLFCGNLNGTKLIITYEKTVVDNVTVRV